MPKATRCKQAMTLVSKPCSMNAVSEETPKRNYSLKVMRYSELYGNIER
jgi:hypothetical protein